VHVALWCEDDLATGAVALPAIGTVLSTAAPPPPISEGDGHLRIAVSRTRAPALAERVADRLGGELVPLGSAGYKVAAVVLGEVDAYLHAGGQYEWDSAAPVAVARAAGLHTSRLDGSPLQYNQPEPYLPDLVVCRRELATALLTAIRENLS
jgi:3'(2'), 5'-bisphosphate nucleotidase